MPVVVSMLRGINVGGHNQIRMEALRALYESLKLRDVTTYVQSGNVVFLASEPGKEVCDKLLAIDAAPEELRIAGRELYIYYANGMGRAKLAFPILERTLKIRATARNWNTVTKLLEIAEKLEAGE